MFRLGVGEAGGWGAGGGAGGGSWCGSSLVAAPGEGYPSHSNSIKVIKLR